MAMEMVFQSKLIDALLKMEIAEDARLKMALIAIMTRFQIASIQMTTTMA